MSDQFRNNHTWNRDAFKHNHDYAYAVVLHIILHCHRTLTAFSIRQQSDIYNLCSPNVSRADILGLESQVVGLKGEIRCLESGTVLLLCSGNRMEMLSLDQDNPALFGDSVGQKWSLVCWGYNR